MKKKNVYFLIFKLIFQLLMPFLPSKMRTMIINLYCRLKTARSVKYNYVLKTISSFIELRIETLNILDYLFPVRK